MNAPFVQTPDPSENVGPEALVQNRALWFAVMGSAFVHLLVFLLVALKMAFLIFPEERSQGKKEPAYGLEKMTIILPQMDTKAPVPEVPVPGPDEETPRSKAYFHTTQNEGEAVAPERSDFLSDRNTTAASELPADPLATAPIPTQEGSDLLDAMDLKARDYRDGEIKDDEALPTPSAVGSQPAEPVNPNPIVAEVDPPEDPVNLGEQNEATDPDADGPDLDAIPENPREGAAPDGIVDGDVNDELLAVGSLLGRDHLQRTGEMAHFRELIGGEDLFPVPRFPDTVQRNHDTLLKNTGVLDPVSSSAAAPLPEALRPEVTFPAELAFPEPRPEEAIFPAEVVEPAPRSRPSLPLPGDPNSDTRDAYQPHTREWQMRGNIRDRGRAAVNAEDSPLGRYVRQVRGEIGRRWHLMRSMRADYFTFGTVEIQFVVNPQGRTQNARVISSDANPIMTDATLSAVVTAQIEPMPPEVLRELSSTGGLLPLKNRFVIY